MVDRRTFITAAGSLIVPRFACAAPPKGRMLRIGTLGLVWAHDTTLGQVLTTALRTRGYVIGRDIVFEERTAESNAERLPSLAADLVQRNVDIIVAGPAVAIRAAHDATTMIPIVMAFSADDPVKSGFVANLARPGGNVTGITALTRELAPKSLELLRDAVPGVSRIAVLTNPARPEHAEYFSMMEARRRPGVTLHRVAARGPDQYESAFAAMTDMRADAVSILADVAFTHDCGRLATLAQAHRLASTYPFRVFALAGGLLTYGPDEFELLDLAADYIDKIANGANPAELPVQQPTSFHLAINTRTASGLGLTIPRSLLLRADELIG